MEKGKTQDIVGEWETGIQSMLKGLCDLHKQINRLLGVPGSVYKNLQPSWWQFKYT